MEIKKIVDDTRLIGHTDAKVLNVAICEIDFDKAKENHLLIKIIFRGIKPHFLF